MAPRLNCLRAGRRRGLVQVCVEPAQALTASLSHMASPPSTLPPLRPRRQQATSRLARGSGQCLRLAASRSASGEGIVLLDLRLRLFHCDAPVLRVFLDLDHFPARVLSLRDQDRLRRCFGTDLGNGDSSLHGSQN